MARDEANPDPLAQGKGRIDEVDQSRGIFPAGVPHPEGAPVRAPGALGGGPYEESGRGGVAISLEQSSTGAGAAGAEEGRAQRDQAEQEDEPAARDTEPVAALPPAGEPRG